ncbi:hypothetical protein SAMN05421504_103205 [Amycolatopsis xylanica]|uniref:Uncharacterized protein n=1 Tax=Amycolatopsis xylanica TaxID=589385 RepID=A0A1H3D1H2_9PSEU|nr:hypothetical protein [Amycolatopsis xylanica]SDX59529.1 hypothetical protein SAMN05421504_103205 [Amycolatopsis xylanica]
MLARLRVATGIFAICFMVSLGIAGYEYLQAQRHHGTTTRSPAPTHCVERSGGDNECPGN